jgi:TonB-linked SusC/RagA family outer membrane protein
MKITAVIVFVLSMHVYAGSYGQSGNISLKMNSTFQDVIEELEEVSGYHFVLKYDEEILNKMVDVNYDDNDIDQVLNDLLNGTDYTYKIIDRYVAITRADEVQNTVQNQMKISGQVTDNSGAPLPGVTVVIKGTANGTITDFDGNYTIDGVSSDATLIFSFVGMSSQEIGVAGQSVINVQLQEESIGLEEIVAVGYGIQRKADLTGAIEVVELKSIENLSMSTGNTMQALQGQVPGLYIEKTGSPNAANSRILIRGVNTLGDNNPLYIIDGVPTKRPEVFQSLGGSIESVQVLKDASASSIYGARASNGVVIVTTKNGSKNKGGVSIRFNSNLSIQSEKPQRFKMMNSLDRGRVLWRASVNDGVSPESGYGEIYNFDWNGDYDNPVLNNISKQQYVGGDPNVIAGNTDWQEQVYETGYVTNNELTISGGDDKSSVLMSMGYINNTGMLKFTDYDRITARINGYTSFFDKKLKIGMNTQYVSSNETLETIDLGSAPTPGLAINLAPTIPVYTEDGQYAGPIGSGYSDRNNPLHMQDINRWDNTNKTFFFGNVYAEVQPIKNLVFRTNLGVDYATYKDDDYELKFTEGFITRSVNSLIVTTNKFINVTWSNTLNYKLDMGKSKFDFLLGVEAVSDDYSDLIGRKNGFSTQTKEFMVLSAGTSGGNSFGTGTSSRLFSQFGKINYNLSDKYLASVTIRRDGSSRFGADNRYGVFPAATFGWRISEEAFMDKYENLSNLKLRLGAGRVGNQDIGDFASLGLFEPRYGTAAIQVSDVGHVEFFDQYWNVGTAYDLGGVNTGSLPSGFAAVQGANPALKWETTNEVNAGIDFGFWNSRLIGAFDYFSRKTSDILIVPPVASAVGEGQQKFLNGATKENKGWEFAISYFSEEKNDFSYEVTAQASHFADQITELPEEVRTAYPGNVEQSILGHSELSIFGYETDGLFQSQAEVDAHADQIGAAPGRIRYKDLNDDGEINDLDQKFLGTLLPDLEYSLRVGLNYKKFDLSIFGSGIMNKTSFDLYSQANQLVRGRDNGGPGLLNAWTPQNTNTSIPALTLSDRNGELVKTSNFFNVDASYFKIRNVQLGYNLPKSILDRIGFKQVRVYTMVDNLFVIKSKEFEGPDPERTNVDAIPIPRTVSFGVNVSL